MTNPKNEAGPALLDGARLSLQIDCDADGDFLILSDGEISNVTNKIIPKVKFETARHAKASIHLGSPRLDEHYEIGPDTLTLTFSSQSQPLPVTSWNLLKERILTTLGADPNNATNVDSSCEVCSQPEEAADTDQSQLSESLSAAPCDAQAPHANTPVITPATQDKQNSAKSPFGREIVKESREVEVVTIKEGRYVFRFVLPAEGEPITSTTDLINRIKSAGLTEVKLRILWAFHKGEEGA